MSAAEPGLDAALEERLAALVDEARAAGRLGELDAAYRARRRAALEAEARAKGAAEPPEVPRRFGMIGDSPKMRELYALLERVAGADVPVLVLGETGTGKELVARALHEESPRRAKPFLAENCAAVPASLLESELFGHRRGSFTGAVADRDGHFVAADGGTVFLDEIGDMPLEMQAKLLRVLQEGEVRPVGANATVRVDVRVVAATNKNLETMCAAGTFRTDLYYRLNVVGLQLPPLREREGDVAHLVRWFLWRSRADVGRTVTIAPEALALLERWRWPGNVRELENEVQRAAVLCGGEIRPEDLSRALRAGV